MKFTYRLKQLEASSAKYGHCEVCGKFVPDVYLQSKQHERKIAGEIHIINDTATFGHKECLESIQVS